MTHENMCTFIYVKLLMMFATKCQSETTFLFTRVRFCTTYLPKPLRWEPLNDIGLMKFMDLVSKGFIC